MKIGSIWISGGFHYSKDKFEHRYNWIHSSQGNETNTSKVHRTVYIIELAIL